MKKKNTRKYIHLIASARNRSPRFFLPFSFSFSFSALICSFALSLSALGLALRLRVLSLRFAVRTSQKPCDRASARRTASRRAFIPIPHSTDNSRAMRSSRRRGRFHHRRRCHRAHAIRITKSFLPTSRRFS